jgi:hypothetical protein
MKVFVVEGDVSEMREAFPDIFRNHATAEGTATAAFVPVEDVPANGSGYTPDFEEWLAKHRHTTYSGAVRELIDRLVAEGLRPEIGVASKASDGKAGYVRIHIASARSLPALAYVYPKSARVNIRLPEDVVTDENKHMLAARGVKEDDMHKVVAAVTDGASVDVVVDLIRAAKEHVENNTY